jgi:hypothetical protein
VIAQGNSKTVTQEHFQPALLYLFINNVFFSIPISSASVYRFRLHSIAPDRIAATYIGMIIFLMLINWPIFC